MAPLAAVLAEAPEDPFTPDVVAVPTRGVERWLAQRLSHHLGAGETAGICANVDFRGPRRLVEQVVADLTDLDPDDDPWRPERLAWSVLEVLDAHLAEPWAAPLARYVGDPGDEVRRGRRLTLARRLADLLVDYARQRPEVVLAWSATSPETGDTPDDLAWQPELLAPPGRPRPGHGPRTSCRGRGRRAPRRPRGRRPPAAAVRVRPDAAPGGRAARAARARRAPRRPPVARAPVARAVGEGRGLRRRPRHERRPHRGHRPGPRRHAASRRPAHARPAPVPRVDRP